MGVYINMEMPTSCGYCPLRHEARDGDECYLGASLTEYQKRPDDCPLVHVPEHGRLVDADRLLSERMKRMYYHLPNGDTAIPIIDVENAPTIIPESAKEET